MIFTNMLHDPKHVAYTSTPQKKKLLIERC